MQQKRTQKQIKFSKSLIFTSISEKKTKKTQELPLLEQYTQLQTEKKQELRAF